MIFNGLGTGFIKGEKTMYLALGIVFLVVLLLTLSLIIIFTALSVKKGNGIAIKKNWFYLIPAFLLLYFLHVIAMAYNGKEQNVFSLFSLINTILYVIKFKVEESLIMSICNAYPFFYADFVLAIIIGEISLILSFASFFGRRINNYINVRKLLRYECDIAIGDSKNTINYVKKTKSAILLCSNVSSQRYTELLKEGIPVLRVSSKDFSSKISTSDKKPVRFLRKLKNDEYNFIVFRDNKFSYTKNIDGFKNLKTNKIIKIHLEANQREMKIIKDKFLPKLNNCSNLYVTSFSKYELIARRFVLEHPITKYIPREFYKDNCSVKSNKEINVVFVGFGKVNYQLFRMFAMQFHFAQEVEGKLQSKPVNYYIYDNKDQQLHNELFSKILFEFDKDFATCDFTKPEKICNIITNDKPVDVNSIEAKAKFSDLVSENSFTYFIVSLENDLEDASYAYTLKRLFNKYSNYRIFVRTRNTNSEKIYDVEDNIICFGEEKTLYTHDNIINDDLTKLAQKINILYKETPDWLKTIKENATSNKAISEQLNIGLNDPDKMRLMLDSWNKLTYIKQASNFYHALNIPFKLNLLGFDMVKNDTKSDGEISEEYFNKHYINSGRINGYNDYSFFFKTESSNVLAYIEHSRWNALYIFYDYVQMKKSDMKLIEEKDDDGNIISMPHKNEKIRQHACITTYHGLNELIQYKYETMYHEVLNDAKFKNNERLNKLAEVYAYDYMDLDRLYSEIIDLGYKLILKQE